MAFELILRCLGYPRFLSSSSLPGKHDVAVARGRVPLPPGHAQPSVYAAIMYPTSSGTGQPSTPYWRSGAVDGMAEYANVPPWIFRPLAFAAHHSLAPEDAPLPDCPIDNGKWPVVIFSHGLGGHADMYSSICRALASFGCIVVALEHEDGSGSYATRADAERVPFVRPPAALNVDSHEEVSTFRKPFLEHRLLEIQALVKLLYRERTFEGHQAVNRGVDDSISSATAHMLKLLDACDPSRISLVGHSFGGATMALAAQRLQPDNGFRCVVMFDPWAFSLPGDVLDLGLGPSPGLAVMSEAWVDKDGTQIANLLGIDSTIPTPPRGHLVQTSARDHASTSSKGLESQRSAPRSTLPAYFLPGTAHASFSDTGLWFPSILTEAFAMKGRGEDSHLTHTISAEVAWAAMSASENPKSGHSQNDASGGASASDCHETANFDRRLQQELLTAKSHSKSRIAAFRPRFK